MTSLGGSSSTCEESFGQEMSFGETLACARALPDSDGNFSPERNTTSVAVSLLVFTLRPLDEDAQVTTPKTRS